MLKGRFEDIIEKVFKDVVTSNVVLELSNLSNDGFKQVNQKTFARFDSSLSLGNDSLDSSINLFQDSLDSRGGSSNLSINSGLDFVQEINDIILNFSRFNLGFNLGKDVFQVLDSFHDFSQRDVFLRLELVSKISKMFTNGGDEVFNGMLKGRFEKVIKDVVPVRLSLSSPILAMMVSSKSTKRPLPDSTPALALAMIAWTAASTFSKIALTAGVAAAILASTAALILFKKSMILSLTSPDIILALTWAKMSFKSWTASITSVMLMYSLGLSLSARSPRCLPMVGMRFSMACLRAGLRTSLRRSSKMLEPAMLSLSSAILAMMVSSKSTKRPLPDSTPALALAMIAWTAASTFSKIALTAGVAAAILASTAALILFKKSMMLSLTSPDSILALTWAKMSFKSWTASMISTKAH